MAFGRFGHRDWFFLRKKKKKCIKPRACQTCHHNLERCSTDKVFEDYCFDISRVLYFCSLKSTGLAVSGPRWTINFSSVVIQSFVC